MLGGQEEEEGYSNSKTACHVRKEELHRFDNSN